MRWVKTVAHTGKKINIYIYIYIQGFGGKTCKKRDHLQDSGANGKIILTLMLNRKTGQGLD